MLRVWTGTHGLPRLDDPRARVAVERAYWELGSLEWWFRRTYNLPPTDPRFLNASQPEMQHDYWLHTLTNRLETAARNDVPVESLDDLIAGVTPDERAAAIDKEISAKYAAQDAEAEKGKTEEEAEEEERETVIEFRGKPRG